MFDRQGAIMHFDEESAKCKAKTSTWVFIVVTSIYLVEPFKHRLVMFRGNTRAVVEDIDVHMLAV